MDIKRKFILLLILYQFFLVFIVFFSIQGIIAFASAQTTSSDTNLQYYNSITPGLLGIGAGLAAGLATIGAGIAIKTVGTSVISAIIEREEMFGRAFIILALAEALAIYGLIIGILLWTKIPSVPS
ncbi:MAG: ATP synthase subunit C [Promethearchaeota archaeon]